MRLSNTIQKLIHEDMSKFMSISTSNLTKVHDVLIFLCSGGGTSNVNVGSLAKKLHLNFKTTSQYVDYLVQAWLIYRLSHYGKLNDTIRKEKKLFVTSTNIAYLFGQDIGFMRESYFLSTILKQETIPLTSHFFYLSTTDFVLQQPHQTLFFEIGGKNKQRTQQKNQYTIKDNISIGNNNTIPLRLFGLL